MNGILVVAEIADGAVRPETLAALALARALRMRPDEPIGVLMVAPDPPDAGPFAVEGVGAILHVQCEAASDAVALAVVALAREAPLRLILAGYTVTSVAYGPRLAIELDAGFASGVLDATGRPDLLRVRRDVYGGRLQAELGLGTEVPAVLLVRTPAASLELPSAESPPVTARAAPPADQVRSRHLRTEAPDASEVDLAGARLVVGIGRGIGDRESVVVFEDLATQLGATLASSRPLVDAGWIPRERQVGQSGTTIAPTVYLAFGISGAAEHLAGIRGAQTVVAVNTDPRAPIFGTATYGAVADALDVAGELARTWT